MKKILLILIPLMLLIAGCSNETTDYQKPETSVSGPDVKQTDLPSGESGSSAKAVETEKTQPELSDEILDIIKKSETISSLEYTYNEWELSEPGYNAHVYLKENKMKHEFNSMQNIGTASFYNTVYLDSSKKTAKAYCEDNSVCDDQDKELPVDYGLFQTKTPFDVLDDMTYGTKTGSEMISGREAIIIEYEKDGKTTKVWLWEYKGIPLKYEEYDKEEKTRRVEFGNLNYNGIKDSDLMH